VATSCASPATSRRRCGAAASSTRCAYGHRNADPEFERAWLEAEQKDAGALESEAGRRAVEGFEEPIMYQVTVVGHVRKYSDRMLELLLKAHRP
jgi:hypothetical protein